MFLARVERLPVTSRSHVTDITDVTDNCKISIMIAIAIELPCQILDIKIVPNHTYGHENLYSLIS